MARSAMYVHKRVYDTDAKISHYTHTHETQQQEFDLLEQVLMKFASIQRDFITLSHNVLN